LVADALTALEYLQRVQIARAFAERVMKGSDLDHARALLDAEFSSQLTLLKFNLNH
jgi:hypothetical protein